MTSIARANTVAAAARALACAVSVGVKPVTIVESANVEIVKVLGSSRDATRVGRALAVNAVKWPPVILVARQTVENAPLPESVLYMICKRHRKSDRGLCELSVVWRGRGKRIGGGEVCEMASYILLSQWKEGQE